MNKLLTENIPTTNSPATFLAIIQTAFNKSSLHLFVLLGCHLFSGQVLLAQTPPEGFSSLTVGNNWNQPVGLTFTNNGQMFVWEKAGRVWMLENDTKPANPLLDISEEVGDWRDHGLLGFTPDPDFEANGFIYLLYVVDRHHLTKFGTPAYRATSNEYYQATIGRLTRYQVDLSTGSIVPQSRKILLGESITTGIPITSTVHGVAGLVFGSDGTLLLSCGDGASAQSYDAGNSTTSYYAQALTDGIIPPQQNVGAFRAQQIDALNGKVLRLDPQTGNGVPSNPYFDAVNPRSARSRVWAMGLRNPFRMSRRPDTGSKIASDGNPGVFYIGDVGLSLWEEINVLHTAKTNFGWPVYEGLENNNLYNNTNTVNPYAPNPLYQTNNCQQSFFQFNQLLQQDNPSQTFTQTNPCDNNQIITNQGEVFVHTRPTIDWRHRRAETRTGIFQNNEAAVANLGSENSPVSGSMFTGDCAIGGVWYTGTAFPPSYQNKYFFGDYTQGWIKIMSLNGFDKPTQVENFIDTGANVVCMAVSPVNGALYYVHLGTTEPLVGEVRKIVSSAGRPPIALASANKNYGPGPLTVSFTGNQSYDPNGFPISYAWDFGDGSPISTSANPSHQFSAPANTPTAYQVTLTVSNTLGLTHSRTLWISLNNTPPRVSITSPIDFSTYSLTNDVVLPLTATVSDQEHGPADLRYEWQTILHHNNHVHEEPVDLNPVTSATISPIGCDGETYFYTVRLTVTDAAGLSTTKYVSLLPDCNPYLNVSQLETSAGDARITLRWNNPAEPFDEIMIVAKAKEGIRAQPGGDGSLYLANSDFAATSTVFDGGKVVFKGQDSYQTINGLINDSLYFFRVFTRLGNNWSAGTQISARPSVITGETPTQSGYSFAVYPNPASETLRIRMTGKLTIDETKIALFNSLGRSVAEQTYSFTAGNLASGSADVDLAVGNLARGMYSLQIRLGKEVVQRKVLLH